MKKIIILLLIFFVLFGEFVFIKEINSASQGVSQSGDSDFGIRFFYEKIRPSADIKCLGVSGSPLDKISNCINKVILALQTLAVILFVISLTYTAGLMIIAPFKTDSIKQAKTILLWIIIGFIILFIAGKIMELIQQLAK